jgi:hypothetical protein
MRNREPSSVQPDVTAKSIEEFRQGLAKTSVLALQLINGLLQAVGDRYFPAGQPALQLAIMIALDSIRFRPRSCSLRYARHLEIRPSIGEIITKITFRP